MDRNGLLDLAAQRIDSLISIDVPSRNVIHVLYPLAREKTGKPLCMAAAQLLMKSVTRGGVVLIATGWPDRPHISPSIAETDGPPGAAALARALHRGLGAVPIAVVEENLVEAMEAVMRAAGFRVVTPQQAVEAAVSSAPIHAASVVGFPTDAEDAKHNAQYLFDRLSPQAVVTIEKGGMNEKSRIHTSRGADTSTHMSKADYLVLEAQGRGVKTVGIGDGGNEIGMGVIREGIVRLIRFGDRCNCGCGGGIAPSTVTDVLVAAAISNWGAYGVAACLAILLQDADVFHNHVVEGRMLDEACRASLIDGITGYCEPSADGLQAPVHQAFVTLMLETVRQVIRSLDAIG
ncbi:MAG: DUF4392 domain-containing protein [Firmicutes bacterium]|nr:DUF4392 domain-containing protein [Bacillota bacterium]